MARLHWGLLSTARINRQLIPAIRSSARSELTTVASRSRERAEAYAAEWKIPRTLGSYEALLSDPEIDIIYVPLPNSLHAEWTIRALDAGKHVLCEKPLALTVEDVDRIADAAARARRIAAEAFMYRHHPLTREAHRLVTSGRLGEPQVITGAFTFPLTREGDVRLDPALGGGSLWDVGCYPVSYACMLAGTAPDEVFGWQRPRASEEGVDRAFAGMMRFADGTVALFDSGFLGPFRAEMAIAGRSATLTVERPFRTDECSRLLLTVEDTTESLPFDPQPAFAGEIADMESAALGEAPPGVTLADSRRTVATICALYESARTGRVVPLEN